MLSRRLKREFHFSSTEVYLMLGVALLTGLILSFRMWGEGQSVDVNLGIESLILMSIMSIIAIFVHFAGEKIYAIWKGMETKYQVSIWGIGISLFVTVMFNGFFFILAPGWLSAKTKQKARIGKWRYRPYYREYGYMANYGIFSNLLIAAIFGAFIANPIIDKLVKANLLIAAFSLIPAPKYDGFHMFFGDFGGYAFMVGFTAAFAFTLYYVGFWYGLLAGLILGLVGFFFVFNKGWNVN